MSPRASQPDNTRPERFESTRRAHKDETAEDYVEAIAQLIEERGVARVGALAELMGVSHVTVSKIITRLQSEGLVTTQPRHPIELTDAGRDMAAAAIEKHKVVLGFLLSIGVPEQQAQIDAEGIEHHVSPETLAALRRVIARLSGAPDQTV
jgi:DtxR family manganese transport transcriptional regulator